MMFFFYIKSNGELGLSVDAMELPFVAFSVSRAVMKVIPLGDMGRWEQDVKIEN